MKFISAILIASASAVSLSGAPGAVVPAKPGPIAWDPDTLPPCPNNVTPVIPRTLMDDGVTHVVKYPKVGASCKLQIGDMSLIMTNRI